MAPDEPSERLAALQAEADQIGLEMRALWRAFAALTPEESSASDAEQRLQSLELLQHSLHVEIDRQAEALGSSHRETILMSGIMA